MTKYDKLVRDRIPDIIRSRGEHPVTRVADEHEYRERLSAKLREEVQEYVDATDDASRKEELADVLEVVSALAAQLGCADGEIEMIRAKKAAERGAFAERIILLEA